LDLSESGRQFPYDEEMGLEEKLEALLVAGKDAPQLRVSLAQACLARGDSEAAVTHLEQALEQDPGYTAAWKFYGHALVAAGRDTEARAAWQNGLQAAERHGDRQAGREMQVFLKRLDKQG